MNSTRLLRFSALVLFAALCSGQAAGADDRELLPPFYQKFVTPLDRRGELDYVVIELNGEVKVVARGKTLRFVRGDKLKVRQAVLKRSTGKPEGRVGKVNVIGFHRYGVGGQQDDDRGQEVDTTKFLNSSAWQLAGEEGRYAVVATTGTTLHGLVFLQRQEPTLLYVDVHINARPRVMREGETLRLKASDIFKVDAVFTNLKKSDDVHFHMVERQGRPEELKLGVGADYFDIVFSHRAQVFAKIPLIVEKL